jgi:SAM-dependent methyltransferase
VGSNPIARSIVESSWMSKLEHFYESSKFGEEWFSYPTLYTDMVHQFPSGSKFVEVGCWKGRSSAYMCVEIANSTKDIDFYCVDIWNVSPEREQEEPELKNLYDMFLENLKPVEAYYKPMKIPSVDAAKKFKDGSLDFVFIDAGHEYDAVKEDILAWFPKIKPGGILAGHDLYPTEPTWGDVYKVVEELFPNKYETRIEESCFLVRK